jgi:hypothetical protein
MTAKHACVPIIARRSSAVGVAAGEVSDRGPGTTHVLDDLEGDPAGPGELVGANGLQAQLLGGAATMNSSTPSERLRSSEPSLPIGAMKKHSCSSFEARGTTTSSTTASATAKRESIRRHPMNTPPGDAIGEGAPAGQGMSPPEPISLVPKPPVQGAAMRQLGGNAHGEILEPGRVPDCYLGLLLDPLHDQHTGRMLVVAPAALLHPTVPQPDGTVLYELLTGHPDRRRTSWCLWPA